MHRQDRGRLSHGALGSRRLEGQRGAQAEGVGQPGEHGRERAERGVVPQDLRDGKVEHGSR